MNSKIITILKPDEAFGGLSKLSEDFPLAVNRARVLTSEHLYQPLKFSDYPENQKETLNKFSPIACKRIANKKDYRTFIRTDWELYIPPMRYPYAMMLKSGMKHRISINQGVSPCIAHFATKKYQTRPNFVAIAVRICVQPPKYPQSVVQNVPHP